MDVFVLDGQDSDCAAFVQEAPEAKLCHVPAWTAMVEKAFGHRGYYLVAREKGQVCGVLPMVHVRSRLFGNRLVSQPFSDYGGPLVAHPAALEPLYHRALEIAARCRCESIEFRNVEPLPYELHARTDKISMCLPLGPDAQALWKGLRHKTRNRVSKAERAGLVVTSGGPELLEEFYRVWTIRMHELGTPCYPRKLFSSMRDAVPNAARIVFTQLNGATTAVLFAYTFKGRVQCSWGAALRDYDEIGPNYILNWKAIEYYCAQGMQLYDFGRSTVGSGQHTFKERWGATAIELCWQYWTRDGREPALARPDDPRYRRKVEMWRKMPLWLTRVVGPAISGALA